MKRLCAILNIAPLYREPIYRLIDSNYCCDWFYGNELNGIRCIATGVLKNAEVLHRVDIGPFYWQKNAVKKVFNNLYQDYIITGEVYCLSTWCLLLLKNLFRPRKRIFLWSHGWYGRESFTKKWMKRIFFGMSDGVFLYGDFAKKTAIAQGFDPKKLSVIHNSLDYESHLNIRKRLSKSQIYHDHFGNDNPTLVFIGRLTTIKKINMLFEAVSILKKDGFSLNVALIGDGSERKALEILAQQIRISENIWFYGACYDDVKTAQLIYDADLCVSPGNVGLTAIHTMTFGTPVLTHNDFTMQMPEFEAIVPGKTGAFFKSGDVIDLAEKIKLWLNTHPNKSRTKQDCYNVIETSWTPKYQLEIIKKVISVI